MIRPRHLPVLVALTLLGLVLAGCGGGSDSSEPATAPGSSADSSSGSDAVDGVHVTPPGTHLALGDTARVSWQPDQKTTGVIAVTVTGLRKMPIRTFSAWRLEPAVRRSTPYFVRATVRNLGASNLSHVPVPLYLLDQRETLIQASTFRARFTPCPSRPLPADFKRGEKASVCLVYFAPDHGKLVAISFRPSQDVDAITWQGKVVTGGQRQHHEKH